LQTSVRFEKLPRSFPSAAPETLRLRRSRTAAQTARRAARRFVNTLKGR
jgi:hypothetical protein